MTDNFLVLLLIEHNCAFLSALSTNMEVMSYMPTFSLSVSPYEYLLRQDICRNIAGSNFQRSHGEIFKQYKYLD